jgi:hypothetical protein
LSRSSPSTVSEPFYSETALWLPVLTLGFAIDNFLLISQTFRVSASSSRDGLRSVGEWLCEGPNICKLSQENDPRWHLYSADVKRLVLSTQNNYWLDYNISDILAIGGQGGTDFDPRTALDRRRPRRPTEREPLSPQNWRKTAMDVLGKLRDAAFLPISVLVYVVNITSALGYLMLANAPSPQQSASPEVYWKL